MAGDCAPFPPSIQAGLAPYIDVLNKHAAEIAAMYAEPTPQEHDMTDHRDECHDGAFDPACAECVGGEARTHTRMLDQMRALLTEIRDALTPTTRGDWLDEPVLVPRPEPEDVTEEPLLAESEVVDFNGNVWWKTYAECWHMRKIADNGASCSTWAELDDTHGPLTLPVEDNDGSGDPEWDASESEMGVDPDEALNRAVAEAIDDVSPPPPAPWDADWLDRATAAAIHAAREHFEAEPDDLKHENEGLSWRWAECADERDAAVARAERAEADVDRLARERDEWEAKYRQVDDWLSRARDYSTARILARDDKRAK